MSRVLRIISGASASPRVIEEQTFIAEVQGPAEGAQSPQGCELPCTIESLDGLGRLRWRAYCSTREGLLDLARELGHERSLAGGGGPRRAI